MGTLRFLFIALISIGSRCNANDDCTKKTSHLASVRLKNDLLCDYDRSIRPVVNHTNTTTVTMRMVLKFFSFDMHNNVISIHSWLSVFWTDEHLKWNPADYESIDEIHLASSDIWIPDLSIYNMNDLSGSPTAINGIDCLVTHKGTIVCVSPNRHDGLCMPKLKKYPFDKQNCTVRFGSWVHSGEEINFKFTTPPVSMTDYVPNGEWNLLRVNVKRFPGNYNCCPDSTYPSLSYNFHMERHAVTFAATIIIPALITIMLTLTTLWMNPKEIERFCVACLSLIIQVLYMETLHWAIPTVGEDPPLLILYGRNALLLSTLSILLTIFLKSMMTSNKPSPIWVTYVVNGVLSNRPGQFFLLHDVSLKKTATSDDDDTARIIKDDNSSTVTQEWLMFAKLIDRLSFLAFSITYFWMFVSFIL